MASARHMMNDSLIERVTRLRMCDMTISFPSAISNSGVFLDLALRKGLSFQQHQVVGWGSKRVQNHDQLREDYGV